MQKLYEIVATGERENIEFKEYLSRDFHLEKNRMQNLACQMNHRMIMGGGSALYVIGVRDDGTLRGIDENLFNETLFVLNSISNEIGAEIEKIEKYSVNGGLIGIVTIKNRNYPKEHILIGSAGHVDHGKSTLIGSLITGEGDDGAGKNRLYLDVLPHEIERGLSAELSYAVYGFENGRVIHLKNPLSKQEKASVVKRANKLVSFVDTVGHEPWLRTTIRGIVGQKLDYGLLVVAADDGVTHVTREHLGILAAMDLQTIIAITKIDRVSEERVTQVERDVFDILKLIGKIPYRIKSKEDVDVIVRKGNEMIFPLIRTSSVTMEGFELLNYLLYRLPKKNIGRKEPFQMYIDKVYQVAGVGTVVSGTVKQGCVRPGEVLNLGPTHDGKFVKVKVQSIEMHYYRVDEASAGDIVGIAIKGARDLKIERGMILCEDEGKAVWEFDAKVMILTHPTAIKQGYEPVLHLETISESVIFKKLEKEYMMAGQTGKVRMRFKFRPHHVYRGQKFIFREGKSKGIGVVIDA
ncbi:MAG: GTPBP1 family GTP-binding protein [Candidatus Syntropharchaeia archaeon]